MSSKKHANKRVVPSEAEVRQALEAAPVETKGPKATAGKKSTSRINIVALVCGLATAFVLFNLIRDPEWLRRRVKAKSWPWTSLALDRVMVILGGLLAFVIIAIAVARRELLRVCRSAWRAARKDTLAAYKDFWKHRKQIGFQYLILFSTLIGAAVAWRLVIYMTECDAPIVVVLSGSMETAFYRGDLLFLNNDKQDPIIPGEIVVFKIDGRDIPIVHRVLQVHVTDNGTTSYLTKGDNNQGNDRSLYAPGQLWLERRNIVGRARFFLPYIGMITVKLNEYPLAKMAVIGGMFIMMLYNREL